MPRLLRRVLGLVAGLIVAAAVGVWAYSTFAQRPDPVDPPREVRVKTTTVAGIAFEIEHEMREGANLLTHGDAEAVAFSRRGEVLEFFDGYVSVNDIGFPNAKPGDVVRWNLEGPLLVNGAPQAPHPLQARELDALGTPFEWTARPSESPRDTLGAAWAGRSLVVAHGDGAVRLWDADKREVVKTMIPDPPKAGRGAWGLRAAVSPDGKTIAAANAYSEELTLWEAASGNKLATLTDPKGKVLSLGFASNDWLLEARDGALFARTMHGTRARVLPIGKVHDQFPASFVVSQSRTVLAVNDGSKVACFTLESTAETLTTKPMGTPIEQGSTSGVLALSFEGKLLAVYNGDTYLAIHDTSTGKPFHRLRWRSGRDKTVQITALAFAPDGKTLAIGNIGSIRLYDVETGRERGGMQTVWVRSLAYSADGRTLAAGLRYLPGLVTWDTADFAAK